MNRYSKIAEKVATRPKVLIEKVSRRTVQLSWNYTVISPLDEDMMDDFTNTCREQTQRESILVAQALGVSVPKIEESYVTGVSKDRLKVIVDVSFGVLPENPITWDDVVDELKQGGWL
jgi:hypothetical protein